MNVREFFTRHKTLIYWCAVSAIFALLILIQYYAPLRGHYLIPPGDDPYNHFLMAKLLQDKEITVLDIWRAGKYPPGFHLLLVGLSNLSGIGIIKIMIWIYPAILVLAAAAIFFLSYVAFGRLAAFFTLIFYSFFSNIHVQLQNDGGYPNLIAAGIFIPLFIAFLILLFRTKKFRFLLLAIISAGLVLFTHHLSTFYLGALIFGSAPFILIWLWKTQRWSWKIGVISLSCYVFFLYAAVWLFQSSALFAPARFLANRMVDISITYPFIIAHSPSNPKVLWPLDIYPSSIGQIVFYFGIIAIPYGYLILRRRFEKYWIPLTLLTIWAIFLFWGSRLAFLSDPARLARDLVVPLVVLAGFLVKSFYRQMSDKTTAVLLLSIMLIAIGWHDLQTRYHGAYQYSAMVRITSADQELIDRIKTEPGQIIYTNATHPWLQYFLPDRQIVQKQVITDTDLTEADLIYLVDWQMGWSPTPVNSGNLEITSSKSLTTLAKKKSNTNEVELIRVNKNSANIDN